MGSNMQRQAVPLLESEKCIVGTGLKSQAALDSGSVAIAK
jgi:DNA-directed RNA polymerase subunit beta